MVPDPDILFLRWLARRSHAAAPTIGTACAMSPGELRARLAMLESMRLIASRQDKDAVPPRRLYYVTAEGRRKAGIVGARAHEAGRRVAALKVARVPDGMPNDADEDPAPQPVKPGRHISEATREAGRAAREAKRAQPDPFGMPEVFVVGVGGKAFTWELRRFGGVVLQRCFETFLDAASAREDGERALAALIATPDLPTFRKGAAVKPKPPGTVRDT